MRHVDPERLTLLALDDDVPPPGVDREWERAHLAECPVCGQELAALRHVIGLGREAEEDDLRPPAPPPAVWDAIRARVPTADGSPISVEKKAGPRRRVPVAVAAGALGAVLGLGVALGIGGTVGWQHLSRPDAPTRSVVASTTLAPIGSAGGTGDARLVRTGGRLALEVDVRDLPLTNGYYEAWMFVPGTTRMQAMGTVRPGEVARFPVPAGLDPAGWRGIDVSAEAFDGDPAHSATSVLRGELRR
ncbi:anti-sigma factor domain-containing protein [Cryptosporangium sp. NPDC051539]|uniref:anti-sigma factor n=1 Tax=Cryptosporangium sp. NPDC051539 TaxID=3363962 RepID=UPI00379EE24D